MATKNTKNTKTESWTTNESHEAFTRQVIFSKRGPTWFPLCVLRVLRVGTAFSRFNEFAVTPQLSFASSGDDGTRMASRAVPDEPIGRTAHPKDSPFLQLRTFQGRAGKKSRPSWPGGPPPPAPAGFFPPVQSGPPSPAERRPASATQRRVRRRSRWHRRSSGPKSPRAVTADRRV